MTALALAYLHLPFVRRRTGAAPTAPQPLPEPVVPLTEFDESCRPVSAWQRDMTLPDLVPADASSRWRPRRRRGGES
jgi:hypothetical protein